MPSRPERVLVIRSGRHLHVALEAVRRRMPGATIAVLATPGTEAGLEQLGVYRSRQFIYRAAPTFDAWPLLRSGLAVRLWAHRFDRVVALWLDPDGSDRANVDRAALLLSPGGFDAVTPDGSWHHRRGAALAFGELRRAARSMAIDAALTCLLFLPARLGRVIAGHRGATG
ncbi:MAG: hypothetical protein AB7O67_14945 [Vicinamibacterales bacterium]